MSFKSPDEKDYLAKLSMENFLFLFFPFALNGFREEHQKVADIFLSRESGFNHHTTYIMQFDRNLALLDDVRLKSSQLDAIIKEFEVKSLCVCMSCCFIIVVLLLSLLFFPFFPL